MDSNKKLFLLDAYALIYRAYFGFIRNPMYNSKGMNTSAVFGFVNTLAEVLKKEAPSHIAVVFDPPTKTFRHEIYEEYKAHRDETPEDIRNSVPIIKDIIKAFNIPIIQVDGFEADDTIATLARIAEEKGFTTFMMTPDKDYCQLVTDHIFMYKPNHQGTGAKIIGIPEVLEKFEVIDPKQVIDILALWGDSADNIPGAPGIGEKTSKKLIKEYGSVEKLLENTDNLKGKQKENLENFKEQIMMSKFLVTIDQEVPVEFNEEELKHKGPNSNELRRMFDDLEFKNLANRILKEETIVAVKQPAGDQQGSLFGDDSFAETYTATNLDDINTVKHDYHFVDTAEKRASLIKQLKGLEEFCFDTETTGIDVNNAELVGMSFSWKTREAYYVPVPADQAETQKIVDEFKEVFEIENIKKVGQNIKYDILILKWYDIEVKGDLFDTMIAHYLIQPELRHNLNYLSELYLNYIPVSIETLIGKKGKKQLTMRSVDAATVSDYACEDADLTWQLKEILEKELAENNITELFEQIEMPLINILASMEFYGVKIDVAYLNNYAKTLRAELVQLEKEIYELAACEFNIASPKQLGEVLFDKMKIVENAKKTKTKQYATGEEVLQKLIDTHDIIPKILDFRSLKKLLSTYIEALPKLVNSKTGKIHTSYNQALVATGRLSSNNPNLQNIPIREARGREVRKAFIASDEDHTFYSADYSQVELRLMAHFSKDPHMIEAFINNEDIHASTAAKINKVEISEVTKEMRSQAKSANFGIIYGISAFGLAENLNISRKEAKELIDNYFATYPKVKEYMNNSIANAREKGYVETIYHRRRFLKDINSRNGMVRGIAERNAINAPLQGSAADIIKIAMINIYTQFKVQNLKSKMILQVHDELNFDVYQSELETVKEIVKHEMESAAKLHVPLTVDMGVGNNWLEAH